MTRPAKGMTAVARLTPESRAAAERRMEKNVQLVPFAMNRLNIPADQWEECEQEGRIGLWMACMGFDESRNIRFSTYAVRAISNTITAYLRSRTGRAPGWLPSHGWKVSVESLETPVGEGRTLAHFLPADGDVETEVVGDLAAGDLMAAVDELPDRERTVIVGLIEGRTHAELARTMGVPRGSVDWLVKRGQGKLLDVMLSAAQGSALESGS